MVRTIDISQQFDQHWQSWLEQKQVRAEKGDDLTIEREVEHVILFRWGRRAKRATKIITQSRSVRLSRTNGQPRWILEAIADEDLTDESVRHSLEYMLTIAQVCRGEYDGFGAAVAQAR